nr:MAG TPA: hypothetical protein [Herelleviridae sp.]
MCVCFIRKVNDCFLIWFQYFIKYYYILSDVMEN